MFNSHRKKKMKKNKKTYIGSSLRKTWTMNPVTRIKGSKKAEQSKKACRDNKGEE